MDAKRNALAPTALFLFASATLLWPAILNGRALLLEDSASYYRGGALGVSTALSLARDWFLSVFATTTAPVGAGDTATVAATAIGKSGGARSVIYSLATYLLRGPGNSLFLLAAAQAILVGFLLVQAQALAAPHARFAPRVIALAAIGGLTGAAWYASTAMPDIFAGIAILAIILFALYFERLGLSLRLIFTLIIATAVAVHTSHLLLAVGLTLASLGARFWLVRPGLRNALVTAGWMVAPIGLGIGVLMTTALAGFGEASVAPKRYPITLARSIDDGPGRWHLEKHCARERYAICDVFAGGIPQGIDAILWGPGGVRMQATPEQMERVREEEMLIVRRAASEYPLAQLASASTNLAGQLWEMGLTGLRFGNALDLRSDGAVDFAEISPDRPMLRKTSEVLGYLAFGIALAFAWARRKRLTRTEVALLGLAVIGLVLNAGICGVLSAVTDRYQGRVAWVLPAVALAIWLQMHAGRARASA
ncbi:MAG: hypothetical protein ACKVOP_01475 [Sphingomonadaceae bacterium]